MYSRFDKLTKEKFPKTDLDRILKANMKFVPENIITSMKNALSLEFNPVDKDACHRLLGWDLEKYAYYKRQGCILITLFDNIKKTWQPSCSTICLDPNNHFQEYSSENKCFPLEKVFLVLIKISVNAANKLLDISLIEDIYKQIQVKEVKETLKIHKIDKPSNSKIKIFNFFMKKKEFNVLIINLELMKIDGNENQSVNVIYSQIEEQADLFDYLIENVQTNFKCCVLKKPSMDNNFNLERGYVKSVNDSDVIITLLSIDMMDCMKKWTLSSRTKNQSINSNSSYKDLENFEQNQIDKKLKYQYFLWKLIDESDKMKIGVTFQMEMVSVISKQFPMAFLLPKEMQKLLFIIENIRKNETNNIL